MTPRLDEILNQRKAAILNEILRHGDTDSARKHLRSLVEEYDSINRSMDAARDNPASKRYINVARPIDAIVQYLEDEGAPRTQAEIVDGVLSGGWRGGGREQRRWLRTCINVFLNPAAKGAKGKRAPLKREGDRIGLKTWVPSRWEL